MSVEDIFLKEIENDMIYTDNLDLTVIDLPKIALNNQALFAKYLKILSQFNKSYIKAEQELKDIYTRLYWEFKDGLSEEELRKGRQQRRKGYTKEDLTNLIESDPEYIAARNKLSDKQHIYELAKQALAYISNRRSFDIKNAIDAKKYLEGI